MNVLILLPFLILTAAAGALLCRRFAAGRGSERRRPPPEAELLLDSLDWTQNVMNEYECFSFHLRRNGSCCLLSGRDFEPESDQQIERQYVPLTDAQRQQLEQRLRSGTFLPYVERPPDESVCDEAVSRLCVRWRMPDGTLLLNQWRGGKQHALSRLLKSFLQPDSRSGSGAEESV